MTKRQMQVAEMMALHPEWSDAELARQLGINKATICVMKKKPGFKEYFNYCLDLQWKEYGKKARKQMADLADAGDYRAIEFILKANGVNPSQIIEANVDTTINVTIDD